MRILFFGDSNTWGYNAKDASRYTNRYTQLLKEAFPQHEIIEEGLNGRTLCFDDPFDADRNGSQSIQMLIKSHLPLDLVVVVLGINDAKRIFNSNVYSLEKGIRTILQRIQSPDLYFKYGQVPKVLVVRPVRMHPDYVKNESTRVNFGIEGFAMIENCTSYMKNMAQTFQADFLDTTNVCMADAYDGIHLNEEGHKQLASEIQKKLEEYDEFIR